MLPFNDSVSGTATPRSRHDVFIDSSTRYETAPTSSYADWQTGETEFKQGRNDASSNRATKLVDSITKSEKSCSRFDVPVSGEPRTPVWGRWTRCHSEAFTLPPDLDGFFISSFNSLTFLYQTL